MPSLPQTLPAKEPAERLPEEVVVVVVVVVPHVSAPDRLSAMISLYILLLGGVRGRSDSAERIAAGEGDDIAVAHAVTNTRTAHRTEPSAAHRMPGRRSKDWLFISGPLEFGKKTE